MLAAWLAALSHHVAGLKPIKIMALIKVPLL
jgi:hypothetical protein